MDVYREYRGPVLAIEKVPMANISAYGCVQAAMISERTYKVLDIVEKPEQEEAPSDLAIIGRYILTPDIFPILEKQEPGKGEEIQLTDALCKFLAQEPVYGCRSRESDMIAATSWAF